MAEFIIIVIAAILGVMFDSLLGSLLQAKYICAVCGKKTEQSIHCDERCHRRSGIPFVTNSVVNFLSTAFAFAIVILFLNI